MSYCFIHFNEIYSQKTVTLHWEWKTLKSLQNLFKPPDQRRTGNTITPESTIQYLAGVSVKLAIRNGFRFSLMAIITSLLWRIKAPTEALWLNSLWLSAEDWIGSTTTRTALSRLESNPTVNDPAINKAFVSSFKSKGNSLKVIRSHKRSIVQSDICFGYHSLVGFYVRSF